MIFMVLPLASFLTIFMSIKLFGRILSLDLIAHNVGMWILCTVVGARTIQRTISRGSYKGKEGVEIAFDERDD